MGRVRKVYRTAWLGILAKLMLVAMEGWRGTNVAAAIPFPPSSETSGRAKSPLAARFDWSSYWTRQRVVYLEMVFPEEGPSSARIAKSYASPALEDSALVLSKKLKMTAGNQFRVDPCGGVHVIVALSFPPEEPGPCVLDDPLYPALRKALERGKPKAWLESWKSSYPGFRLEDFVPTTTWRIQCDSFAGQLSPKTSESDSLFLESLREKIRRGRLILAPDGRFLLDPAAHVTFYKGREPGADVDNAMAIYWAGTYAQALEWTFGMYAGAGEGAWLTETDFVLLGIETRGGGAGAGQEFELHAPTMWIGNIASREMRSYVGVLYPYEAWRRKPGLPHDGAVIRGH